MDHPVVITFLIFAIIAFMYLAAEVLKPLALAILLSFALVPISRFLERIKIPRVLSVVLTVLIVMGGLGMIGYEVGQQLNTLAKKLPEYEDNIQNKIKGMKPVQATAITNVQEVVGVVSKSLSPKNDPGIQEVRVVSEPDFGAQVSKMAGPYIEGLGSAFIILVLLLFLMINRENMSDRLIRVFGHGKISLTTRTIEEVGRRISSYLVMFATVNSAFGVVVGLGLKAIGVEYALLWGFLAGFLRFIPYAGAATAFSLPLLFSIATLGPDDPWTKPILVVALYGVLELAANMFLEPMIYGKTTGVSALALLVSAMFWTWLWGGIGLLLSTPLTVCLAVLGKYVPSLGFFATFLREEVDLDPGVRFYQRLLAMDQDGASNVIDAALKKHPRAEVFDKVLIPTLSMAERDYATGDIDDREQAFIIRVVSDVLEDFDGEPEINLASLSTANEEASKDELVKAVKKGSLDPKVEPLQPLKVLAIPANDSTDVFVLRLLAHLLEPSGLTIEIVDHVETPLQVVERISSETPDLVLISHLPPDGLTAARYLVRRIKARNPQLTVIVGRWDEASNAPTAASQLTAAGASAMLASLAEGRDYLIDLARSRGQAEPKNHEFAQLHPANA
jgi:predicted PurR-regulated permease PerM/methylmalonyl-CoA mutase cobalamin-binding subunit